MRVLAGIHAVREALLAGRPLEDVMIVRGAGGARIQEIVGLCRQHSVPVRSVPREALDREAKGTPHQGVVARDRTAGYQEFDAILSSQLLVVLDGVEDPHNLGAIIRTAHAAGAGGVLVPERRAAGLTGTVAKAAAGALEHVPVVRIGNVSRALEDLKKKGYWIYGLDQRGVLLYHQIEYALPTVLVLGGEGHGIHQHVRDRCDFLVRIPMAGAISSLNVSVAAGIVLFEWARRSLRTAAPEAEGT